MTRRAFQIEAMLARRLRRFFCLLFERQAGKTTTMADQALDVMTEAPDRTCIYGSASLLLGREMPLKLEQSFGQTASQIVEKDAAVLFESASRMSNDAKAKNLLFAVANGSTDKEFKKPLSLEAFTDIYDARSLEFRVYHDRARYSRTKVIAPNVATARSWSGWVWLDEIAFISDLKELLTALMPIISTRPDYQLILSTTPPQDDTHYTHELLAPPPGMEFTPHPAGHWYESDAGVPVLRVCDEDSYLAGKRIYDLKTGRELTPEEAFRKALNKDGYRINHKLVWIKGGNAACDSARLATAMERGIGQCASFVIDVDADFDAACTWLEQHIDPDARVALGFDGATTTNKKSNPSVLAVVEEHGPEAVIRAFIIWKTRDPDITDERIGRVIRIVSARKGKGGRPCGLAVDATNEKGSAERQRKRFRSECPVDLIVASENVDKLRGYKQPPGEKPVNCKTHLNDRYVAALDDNHLTVPPEAYIRIDHRLVRKERGQYICEPDEEGRHGDTFDAGKLGHWELTLKSSPGRFLPPAARVQSIIATRRERSVSL